ncbi:hypothetical protein [Jiulongibacter sediminis]|jgi:hypothetical protein|uniref:hypothetical protein n=1 Tax=Jiulongibacter sediminis TaxID=1605367 RepID=UPI0026ED0856|nr:hypothetical protein [Jiulongibacter sediminis]
MANNTFDIRTFSKLLFPIACLLLIYFGNRFDAFNTGFALATFYALFGLLIVELLLVIFKKRGGIWDKLKWLILGAIALLTLIG